VIPRGPLWLVPLLLFLHNLEEALTLPRYLAVAQARAPELLHTLVATVSYPSFLWALLVATLLPLAVVAWAATHPAARWAHWLTAVVQAVFALNVLVHLAAAVALRGYAPGLLTAVLVNLPFSVAFFTRAARERWLTRRALWGTLPAAIALHGPGLLGLLLLGRLLASGRAP